MYKVKRFSKEGRTNVGNDSKIAGAGLGAA